MNVLSLFDGISCGQLALQRAGKSVNSYFASEVDEKAIKVTQSHFPNTVQLGDVRAWQTWNLPKIDLLIGGSPCQGFSASGKRNGFLHDKSSLFYCYVEVLKYYKPKYFLLENVRMQKAYEDVINELIGVEPIEINSALVSKQRRKRLYWTNIQGVTQPIDKGLLFNRWLYGYPHGDAKERVIFYPKYPCLLTTQPGCNFRIIEEDKTTRVATPEECEEFQTLPIGYTSMINKTARYKAIGGGWTVDVIAHILSFINE